MDEVIARPSTTKDLLKKYNIRPYKGLGQNFLIDQNILFKIIDAAELKSNDNIIEIGPGIGSLTQQILNNLDNGKLIAIEKDKRFIKILSDIFSDFDNLELVNEDVLEIDWSSFLHKIELKGKTLKVLANLPYYITTPIIMNLLESNVDFSRLIFMVQKEVGERIVASPGNKDFGSLSVAVQFHAKAEIIHDVPPTVFIPKPRVYSSIVSLTPYKESPYQVENIDFFFKIVKSIFQQRRKNIKNSLSKASIIDLNKDLVIESLAECGIDQRIRGEKLEIETMVQLSNILWNKYEKR